MRKTTKLKELILAPELLVMPGAYDALSARLVEAAGFQAVQCTGYGISVTHLGLPDYSFLGMSDMVGATRSIVDATNLPVMADGDTGFGNAVNAWHAVRAFEKVGCAGVNIEDQVMPKRCGHLDGKTVVPVDEAVAKIKACADARIDPDFVINARTDSLATGGIAEVIRRGNAYLAAGATMVFIDGVTQKDLARQAVEGIRGPVAINVVEGGKSPGNFTFAEMQAIGLARVSLPGTLLFAAITAMRNALKGVMVNGYAGGPQMDAGTFDFHQLLGFEEIFELEKRFLGGLQSTSESVHAG